MSTFSVGQFAGSGNRLVRGQSLTPNIPGDGSGSPGSASQAFVTKFSLGYPSSSTTNRARKVYIYSTELEDVEQIGQSEYLVAQSGDGAYDDVTGLFGTGSFARTFDFTAGALVPSSKYYAYFDLDQNAQTKNNTPYSGGAAYDDEMGELSTHSVQFKVEMYT
jgi:hypothetical protein